MRTLSAKYSIFTVVLVLWVVLVLMLLGEHQELNPGRFVITTSVVVVVAGVISRFSQRVLARPLSYLQAGMEAARKGRLERIRVSRTGDEVQFLGEAFNEMIDSLSASKAEIREHHQLLEERIRQRTDELERATHKAQEASRAKTDFLANLSHELRTPMNGVLGMLEMTLDSRLTNEQKEQVLTAQRCAYSLLGQLNDLLDLSEIDNGKLVLEQRPFDFVDTIKTVVSEYAEAVMTKGLALEFVAGPGIPHLAVGDRGRIRQMADNLIANAVRFTERGGIAVTIGASADGSSRHQLLQIEVRDTGPGIPSEMIPVILQGFQQVDAGVRRKYGGLGLGLAITRRLAELHGGSLEVESSSAGSRFRIEVLCSRAEDPETEAPSNQDAPPRAMAAAASVSNNPRVLVVEDNQVNQKVVSAILRKGLYQVTIASDGEEALRILEAQQTGEPFAAVLMDVQMPVLDGLEATRRIRSHPEWSGLPVVAMTAHAMEGDRRRCLEAGMDYYVTKPASAAVLLQTLDCLVNGKPMERDSPVEGMREMFVERAAERIERIETALEQQDRPAVARESHGMAAAAERIQAAAVRDAARQLGADAEAQEPLTQLTADLHTLATQLEALKRSGSQEHSLAH